MSAPKYIGGDESLKAVCEQVFRWHLEHDLPLLVVIWHEGWKNETKYWMELDLYVRKITSPQRTLIIFSGDSIEEFREKDGGHLLPLLFRLLGRDPDSPRGCCPITAFDRLGSAPVDYDPPKNWQIRLRNKTNEILGLTKSNGSEQ